MLKGRLGLETARIPHADRHGLLWLSRGELCVVDGCLHFLRGRNSLTPAMDQIPHQTVSMILLGPGGSVTQDALRLLARHGTLLAAVGEDGVRSYTAPPLLPDRSDVARRQAELWGNPRRRISVARHMYALRLGEVLPHRDLDTLRGIEGARVKNFYKLMADRHGIRWHGRHYDRVNPDATDLPNQAINHAATAVQAAAAIAVHAMAALPPLGFIHEDSGQSFVLDIADLFRDTVTLQIAFSAARRAENTSDTVDRLVRREAATVFRKQQVIGSMIERIKQVLRMNEVGNGAGDDGDS
ncbi:MAG: type I-E CRISPR-associated endonuclease Cas1 [Rhodobacteraceae bacterium]|nr:type I-E CRISPR-associated endonuclease Cas1 [Paracoccaceae bacterium]